MRSSDWSSDVCSSDLLRTTAVWGGAISNAPHPWTSGVDHGIRRVLCQWTLVRFLCSRLRNSQTCCHGLWISRSLARKFTCPPRLACCRCIFGHGGVLVGASYVLDRKSVV